MWRTGITEQYAILSEETDGIAHRQDGERNEAWNGASEMRPRRRLPSIFIGGLVIIVLGCCGLAGYRAIIFVSGFLNPTPQDPLSNPRVVALLHLPEYQLAYPGAVLLGHGVQQPNDSPFGKEPARAEKAYGIQAPVPAGVTSQAILDWYSRQLLAQGWNAMESPNDSTFSAQSYWRKKGYSLEVGIYDPAFLHQYEPSIDTTQYPLIFQLSLMD